MPIEFRCGQCGKLLRTGDDTAGKQAKCPSCGSVQAIPMSSQPAAPAPGAFPALPSGLSDNPFASQPTTPASPFGDAPPSVETMNPYQSPAGPSQLQPQPAGGAFQPTRIDASDIIDRSWRIFKANWLMCSLGYFLVVIMGVGFGFFSGVVIGVVGAVAGLQPNIPAHNLALQFFTQFLGFFFSTWLVAGESLFSLRIARGGEPDLADLFRGGTFYLSMLPARFLFLLAYIIGALVCFVPGVILALMFWQYAFLIVDRRAGATESLDLSRQLTDGNKGTIFLLILASVAFAVLGVLCFCVGALAAGGFISLMWAVTYLANSGQRTGDQQTYQMPSQR